MWFPYQIMFSVCQENPYQIMFNPQKSQGQWRAVNHATMTNNCLQFCNIWHLTCKNNEPCEVTGLCLLRTHCLWMKHNIFLTIQNNSEVFCMDSKLGNLAKGNTRNRATDDCQPYICACVHCSVTAQTCTSSQHVQTDTKHELHKVPQITHSYGDQIPRK